MATNHINEISVNIGGESSAVGTLGVAVTGTGLAACYFTTNQVSVFYQDSNAIVRQFIRHGGANWVAGM
jgi:hypothetical protein